MIKPGEDVNSDTLEIRPWPDAVIDAVGHDPRSHYVEEVWLGIPGPWTTWLRRRMANGMEASPDGFTMGLADTAKALGLGDKGGRHSPFMRALGRVCQFDLGQLQDESTLAVRRKLPPLNRRQVGRLPDFLRQAPERWQQEQLRTPAAEGLRRRGGRRARSLAELREALAGPRPQL